MLSKFTYGVLALMLTAGVGAGLAQAQMNADAAIKARQACMKQGNAGVSKVGVPMFKGTVPFDAAALKAAIAKQDEVCKDVALWWGPETQKGEKEKTNALPAVWSDKKAFDAAYAEMNKADQTLRGASDLASFKLAFIEFGKTCKSCHEKFRAPQD